VVWSPLYAVVDVEACARAGRSPAETAAAFAGGGARLMQVRAKTLDSGAFVDLTRQVVRLAGADVTVVVNDRADVAIVAGAGGVHVGQGDLPPSAVRRLVGSSVVVGLSTHTVEQAAAALDDPVDYIAIGPVFGTATKDTGYAPVGLDLVRQVAALTGPRGVRLVAIGGITLDRAGDVMAAGADAVCVISDLLRDAPASRVEAFLQALGERK
jgi:thiamine-phosphate pyrophosphorylase